MRLLLAVVVAASASGQRAEACSCKRLFFSPPSEAVALNARFPVIGAFEAAASFVLREASGATVAASATAAPGGFFVVPDAPLAPNTDYVLEIEGEGESPFRTATQLDQTPPGSISLGAFTHLVSPVIGRSTCDLGGEQFTLPVFGHTTEDSLAVFEIFTGRTTATIDTSAPALIVPAVFGVVGVGDMSLCSPKTPTSTVSELAIQARLVDGAGNASELSNAVQLKGGGCSAVGGSAFGLAALLVLVRRNPLKRRRKLGSP